MRYIETTGFFKSRRSDAALARETLETYGLWICSMSVFMKTGYRWNPSRRFKFYGLSQMLGGTGEYVPGDTETPIKLRVGHAVCFTPGYAQDIHAEREDAPYAEDAVGFTGRVADALRDAGIFRDGVLWMGENRRLLPIIELAMKTTLSAQIEANVALQKLLIDLRGENAGVAIPGEEAAPIRALLVALRENVERWESVTDMAAFCNMPINRFRTLFRETTGYGPKLYADRLKCRLAERWLRDKRVTLERVAERLGYSSPFHFSRRFKSVTGYSPAEYRKKSGGG